MRRKRHLNVRTVWKRLLPEYQGIGERYGLESLRRFQCPHTGDVWVIPSENRAVIWDGKEWVTYNDSYIDAVVQSWKDVHVSIQATAFGKPIGEQ